MRNLALTTIVLALAATVLATPACSKKKEERVWQPTDHDQPEDIAPGPLAAASPEAAVNSIWNGTCAPCHGVTGLGDGPAGRSLRVPNLASAAFQDRTNDDDMAKVITNGRGNMPSFQFPPDRIQGLVKKIRSLRQ